MSIFFNRVNLRDFADAAKSARVSTLYKSDLTLIVHILILIVDESSLVSFVIALLRVIPIAAKLDMQYFSSSLRSLIVEVEKARSLYTIFPRVCVVASSVEPCLGRPSSRVSSVRRERRPILVATGFWRCFPRVWFFLSWSVTLRAFRVETSEHNSFIWRHLHFPLAYF